MLERTSAQRQLVRNSYPFLAWAGAAQLETLGAEEDEWRVLW
jgi:hypothetical protein